MLKAFSIISDISVNAQNVLKHNGVKLEVSPKTFKPNSDETKNLLEKYDILIIGVRTRITKEMIKDIKTKKIIATLSIGIDHIDKEVFESKFVKVVNCPTANVTSVAEHILSLIFALNKKILEANKLSNSGKDKTYLTNRTQDISGLTLGVIGAGKISRALIKFAQAFNMNVLCYTKNPKNHLDLINQGVEFVDLNHLMSNSDIISINIPLNNETRNLISKDLIELMKSDATFINTSRAELVDMNALFEKIDNYSTFKVGLDIDVEDYVELFKERNNVIVTPHIAGVSAQAIERMDIELAENIVSNIKK